MAMLNKQMLPHISPTFKKPRKALLRQALADAEHVVAVLSAAFARGAWRSHGVAWRIHRLWWGNHGVNHDNHGENRGVNHGVY